MLTLYTTRGTIGTASHIALLESGLEHTLVQVNFAEESQKSVHYLAINPKARVPSLVLEDQQVLTETPAILYYLARRAPDSPIGLPDNALEVASILSFASYLASTVHVAHAHKLRGSRWTDDAAAIQKLTAYVPTSMAECAAMLNQHLVGTPWVRGEQFSIADPYLYTIVGWFEGDGVNLADYPGLKAHHAAMQARESVVEVNNLARSS